MDILKELEGHGELLHVKSLEEVLKPLTVRADLSDEILSGQRVFYYSKDSRNSRNYTFYDSENADFKIVKFLNTRNLFSHPWCFGFIKVRTPEGIRWTGAYVGKHGELFTKIKKMVRSQLDQEIFLGRISFPKHIYSKDVFVKLDPKVVAKEIYPNLADQSEWDILGGVSGLSVYIKNLAFVARDRTIFSNHVPEGMLIARNKTGYTLLFNSGLLDKYMNFIILRAELRPHNMSSWNEPYLIIEELVEEKNITRYGLTESLPPIVICDKEKLFFPGKDILLLNTDLIEHIIKDNPDRIHGDLKNCSDDILYESLKYSVELAVKMNKIENLHFVPFLNIHWNKVPYLIPMYIKQVDPVNPLCAIVIDELEPGVWVPITILNLEMARSNARLLGKLNASWLTTARGGMVNENSKS